MRSRRDILLGGAGLAALAAFGARAEDDPLAGVRIADWRGDSFAPMHAIRDGAWDGAVPDPARRVDVVVIGGGIAGLLVAALLPDRDVIVLEREAEPGGNARGGAYRGIAYSEAAAYVSDVSGVYGEAYALAGVRPRAVPSPADVVLATEGRDVFTGPARDAWARLVREMRSLTARSGFPDLPIARADARALALDRRSLGAFLGRRHPRLVRDWVDAYCRSALGGGADEVSAYAGLAFLAEITGDIYTLPGGNAAIARGLAERVRRVGAERIATGMAVFGVEPDGDDRLKVGYAPTEGGEAAALSARHVVCAAPGLIAARILRTLDGATRERLRALSYGAYLVANLCFEGRVRARAYDHWLAGERAVADVISADWIVPRRSRSATHSVLTAYAPFRDPAAGRAALLAGDADALARPVVAAVRRHLPAARRARLDEVRLARYGHQLLSSRVGVVEAMRAVPRRVGGLHLAHSDLEGMAAIESAIHAARVAAAAIRGAPAV